MKDESSVTLKNIDELKNHLGWWMGLGIILLVLGTLAVLVPLVATFAVETLIGILFLIGGIMLIVNGITWRKKHTFVTEILMGVIYGAVGLLLLVYPLQGVLTLGLLLTAFFFASGIVKIVHAFRVRPASNWGWVLFSGILSVLLGIMMFAVLPLTAFWAPGLIVGIDLIFTGWSLMMVSWAVRRRVAKGEEFCFWGQCHAII
jgi:uncharacterized membrane protein HdeD (DUF308 family)